MKCPICNKEMSKSNSTTFNKDEKPYRRTTYNCLGDDVWIVVEIPKEVLDKLL